MKAILDATGFIEELRPIIEHRPSVMFRLFDRPMITHVIDNLVDHGITDIHLILSHLPAMVEDCLEEGSRWGAKFTFHLARDSDQPFSAIKPVIGGWEDEPFILGRADVLIGDNIVHLLEKSVQGNLYLFESNKNTWSGWARLQQSAIHSVDPKSPFFSLGDDPVVEEQVLCDHPVMATTNFQELHLANQLSLQLQDGELQTPSTAHMVEKGVWLSRATMIHAKAQVIPPVFLGENCQIMEGAKIGPGAIIENNCLVDRDTVVKNSLVCEQSYVGSTLVVNNCVLDHETLYNLKYETALQISEDFILGRFEHIPFFKQIHAWTIRALALLVFVITSPLTLFLSLCWGIRMRETLLLPAPRNSAQWKTFHFLSLKPPKSALFHRLWRSTRHLPALINMIRGQVHFVGLSPRAPKQVRVLPEHWRNLVLGSKVGAITPSYVDYGHHPSETERLASESHYTAHSKVRDDLRIILLWTKRKFLSLIGVQ